MTPEQRKILAILRDSHARCERVTQRTLAMRVGYDSPSAVHRHLQVLVAFGFIRRCKGGVYVPVRRETYFVWDEDSKALVPFKGREAA